MSGRDAILTAIRDARVPVSPAPAPFAAPRASPPLLDQFLSVLPTVAATGVLVRAEQSVDEIVAARFPSRDDVLVVNGRFAVAENGSVYVDADDLTARAAIVLAEHLVVTVSASRIVATMHEAVRLMPLGSTCGWFLSGPSKTADIEQALVIGAQGARSMLVIVHESNDETGDERRDAR